MNGSIHTPVGTASKISLAARLAETEAKVRAYPARAEHRWELFQLLCVMAQWTRAIQQLQVCSRQQPDQAAMAHACRDLIRAERWRNRVFGGREAPGFLFEPPAWIGGMLDALRLTASGDEEAADCAREAALDAAPLVHATAPQAHVEWIGDSDTRLGPVFEIITAGHYRWLPLADIASWHVERPATLLELVWTPCTLKLIDSTTVRGFTPARYPSPPQDDQLDDALRLGHRTEWHAVGHTAVIGIGQKTWATSAGDFSMFELAAVDFTRPATASANTSKDVSNVDG
ncbi:type VI secretion system accessory protein TagJ [Paraburkholderia sp. BCC1885]|uniref:type VI secretion system accessory protein TagJ n=1 Tax=Paraburkholderia sp. BCC1885 TaxID=2562669 RepID=UPI0011845E7D|nr:type VI secretion system accessory protein TagJ [Paraburkholderia sp. BCC1885]